MVKVTGLNGTGVVQRLALKTCSDLTLFRFVPQKFYVSKKRLDQICIEYLFQIIIQDSYQAWSKLTVARWRMRAGRSAYKEKPFITGYQNPIDANPRNLSAADNSDNNLENSLLA